MMCGRFLGRRMSGENAAPKSAGCSDGFTFVETIVSVILLALVLAAAVPIATSALRSLGLFSRDERKLHALVAAYDLFRRSCGETRIPPWVSSKTSVSEKSGRFDVAYRDGVESNHWSVEVRDGALTIEAAERKIELAVSAPRLARIESEGRTIGLEARFATLGRTWTWRGFFGASGY